MSMDGIMKKVMGGIPNEEIVPKMTKTTTEETTSFVHLDKSDDREEEEEKEQPKKKKAKVSKDTKVKKVVVAAEKEKDENKGHPETAQLKNTQEDKGDKEDWFWDDGHHEDHRDSHG